MIAAFQFTRPHGARPFFDLRRSFHQSSFNSRARMGRDNAGITRCVATSCFNSRARMGRDAIKGMKEAGDPFQFTRPHGARHWVALSGSFSACFNSRARMGRDVTLVVVVVVTNKFQFTRPHGARQLTLTTADQDWKFQFTRPHGARRWVV